MLESAPARGDAPFTKFRDDSSAQRLDLQKEQARRLRELLEARPTEEQLRVLGEPSLKAARVLGEARLATKSASGLAFFGDDGKYDAQAVRRANRELIQERRRRQVIAAHTIDKSMGKPTKDQLDYPMAARKRPVPMKALDLLGDEHLSMEAKLQLPPNVDQPAFKAMKVFGSAGILAPLKARKVLGPSDLDGEARAQADKHWKEEMARRAEEFNKEVYARRPSPALMAIPLEKGPVPVKALRFFGDEDLRRNSLRATRVRAPPKAIQILGDPTLAGSKAGVLTGEGSEASSNSRRRPSVSPLLSYRKLFRFAVGGVEAS